MTSRDAQERRGRVAHILAAALLGALVGVCMALALGFDTLQQDRHIRDHGAYTSATVVDTDLRNHMTCTYRYRVGGRSYKKTESLCPEGVRVASIVRVHYLPSDPSTATSEVPNEGIARAVSGMAIWGVGGAGIAIVLVAARRNM